jgi:hypothetical protein
MPVMKIAPSFWTARVAPSVDYAPPYFGAGGGGAAHGRVDRARISNEVGFKFLSGGASGGVDLVDRQVDGFHLGVLESGKRSAVDH